MTRLRPLATRAEQYHIAILAQMRPIDELDAADVGREVRRVAQDEGVAVEGRDGQTAVIEGT